MDIADIFLKMKQPSETFRTSFYSVLSLVLVYLRPLVSDPVYKASDANFMDKLRDILTNLHLSQKIKTVEVLLSQTNQETSSLISLLNLISNAYAIQKTISKNTHREPIEELSLQLILHLKQQLPQIKGTRTQLTQSETLKVNFNSDIFNQPRF